MPEDNRSDESLIEAYQQGEAAALNALFKRYLERMRFFLLKHTWFKDDNYLDDLIQEIFKIAFTRITSVKSDRFEPRGEGSFKRYLYKIASIECKKQDIARAGQPMPLSQRFPLVSPVRAPDAATQTTDHGRPVYAEASAGRYKKLIRALRSLSGEEIRLLILVNRKVPYKVIITYPMFSKYKTLDSLKQKVYDIRQKVERINEEVTDE